MSFDIIDAVVLLGFILFSIGLAMHSIQGMLIADGILLMTFGLFVAKRKA